MVVIALPPSDRDQLVEMGFDDARIEELLKKKNAAWVEPEQPNFTSRHPTCNAHAHPATTKLNGWFYKLALKVAKYIPCAANSQNVIDTLDVLNCKYAVLKGQTCFGNDNTSLLDSLKYCNENGIKAVGIATVDADVPDEELARLKADRVVGVRHAFLGHIADASDLEKFKAKILKTAERIEKFGFVTNLYFEGKNIEALHDTILEVAKKTPVTLDHMCRINPDHSDGLEQPEFKALCKLIEEGNGRVHVLLSGPDRATKSLDKTQWEKLQPYKMKLVELFPDWVSVGTDFNHPNSDWGVPNDGKLWNWCRKGMSELQWYKASLANPLKFFFGQEVARFDPRLHGNTKPATEPGASPAPV